MKKLLLALLLLATISVSKAQTTLPYFNATLWGTTLIASPLTLTYLSVPAINNCGSGATQDTTGYEVYFNWCVMPAGQTQLPVRSAMPSTGTASAGAPTFEFVFTGSTIGGSGLYFNVGGTTPCNSMTIPDSSGKYQFYIEACAFTPSR